MVVQISVAIIAIAFVVLVIYVIRTLRTLSELLQKTQGAIENLEHHASLFVEDSQEILKNTRDISADLKNKLAALNEGFDSIKQTGQAVNEITHSFKNVAFSFKKAVDDVIHPTDDRYKGTVASILQTIPVIVNIWNKFRK